MNPFLDLLEESKTERPNVSSGRSVEQRNTESLNLLDQMMRGVSKKR